MIKFFTQYELWGIVIRDPLTAASNLLLAFVGLWCFLKIKSFRHPGPHMWGWKMFFLFSAFAYTTGIAVHGFSFYIPQHIHFWVWIGMGWLENIAVCFAQLGNAKRYFPEKFHWIRPLVLFQLVFFSALMVYIRKFGAVNADVAVGLVPIAALNGYLFYKKEIPSVLIAAGILFAALPGVVFALKIMIAPWCSYNDIAHFLLIGSLLIIYKGVERIRNVA